MPKDFTVSKTLAHLANTPMVDWEARIEALSLSERQAVEQECSSYAVQLARLSAYMSRRMTGGKHADAVKRQNHVARKVRQALGYTYAADAITF